MPKWCFNYESGDYEYIERGGFSEDDGSLRRQRDAVPLLKWICSAASFQRRIL